MYCINCGNEEDDNEAISDGYEGACKYCEGFPGGYKYTIYENRLKTSATSVEPTTTIATVYRIRDEHTGLYATGSIYDYKAFSAIGKCYDKLATAKSIITRYYNNQYKESNRKLVIEETKLVPNGIVE